MKPEDLQKRLAPFLRPFSPLYARLMERRRLAYARGEKPAYRTKAPCMSIGNIAWGGTGKTPLVGFLLDWAAQRRLRAVVLSRGYGGKPGEQPLVVTPDTPPERCGDEPLMLARDHPKARVVVFPRRAEAAGYAEKHLAPDLFLLDDGMQHLAVARDLDLVLLRPADLDDDWDRVIPAGPWREGPGALAAASAFFVKAGPDAVDCLRPPAEKRLAGFGRPLFFFDLEPSGLAPLPGNAPAVNQFDSEIGRETIHGDYALATGVGNPAGVEASAARLLGRNPAVVFRFADHHAFDRADARRIAAPGLPVVCTAKDAVKLAPPAAGAPVPFFCLRTRPVFGPALFTDQTFLRWWEERLRALAPALFP